MRRPILLRWARPALLLALGAAVLLLGWRDAAWATPEQNPAGQTIPSPTRRPPRPTRPPRPPRKTPAPYPPPYPAPYASPTPLIGGRVPVGPGSDLKIIAAGGDCIARVTPGDIAVDGAMALDPYPIADVPSPSLAYLYIRSCELKLFDESGQLVVRLPFESLSDQPAAPLPFAGPVDVCFPYTNDDLALAQANPALFTVLRFDTIPGAWVEMPLSLDPVNQTACGATTWPGVFALAIRAADPSNLPNTSGEIAEATARAAPARNAANPPSSSVGARATTGAPAPAATSAPRSAGATIREQPASQPAAEPGGAPPATKPAEAPRSNILIWVLAGVVALLLLVALLVLRRRAARRSS